MAQAGLANGEHARAVEEAAFELADLVVNYGGYADEPDYSDRRADERDDLIRSFRRIIHDYLHRQP